MLVLDPAPPGSDPVAHATDRFADCPPLRRFLAKAYRSAAVDSAAFKTHSNTDFCTRCPCASQILATWRNRRRPAAVSVATS